MIGIEEIDTTKGLEKKRYHLSYISTLKSEGDSVHTPHVHDCTELLYVVHGSSQFIVEDEVFNIKEDDVIIIHPNISHSELGIKDHTLEYIIVGVDGLQFSINDEKESEKYQIHNYQAVKQEVLFYLKKLEKEMNEKNYHYDLVCQNIVEVLIINLIRHTKKNLLVTPTQKITKECRFIEQYINAHFTEDITLELLSEKAYMNKFYLVHSFKQYKGVTPISYLIDLRIQRAKKLLESTNYSIAQIAIYSGFSSQSYFSQVFRKLTSKTPNEYRKIIK